MTHTKKLALCGVFAGLTLALMWMVSFVPSMDYALPAMAGMLSLLLVLELNRLWAFGVYAAAALLCCLLLPAKTVALLYAVFFGYYPILKSLLEEKLPRWLEWVLKMLVFNATMVGAYLLAVELFGLDMEDFGETFGRYAKAILLAVGNMAFIVYDYFILTSFIAIYNKRWRKKLQKLYRN
jgi:hypothetical protein